MPSLSRILVVALSTLIFLGAGLSTAQAEKRIVVLDIEGARSDKLRDTVARLLRPNKTLPAKIYKNAARRLRVPKLNPKSIVKVAKYLEVDGVLDGTLVASDGGYKLILRLRSGKTGMIVSKVKMNLSSAKLSDKLKKGLRRRLLDGVDQLGGGDSSDFDDEGFEEDDSGFEEDDEGGFDDEEDDQDGDWEEEERPKKKAKFSKKAKRPKKKPKKSKRANKRSRDEDEDDEEWDEDEDADEDEDDEEWDEDEDVDEDEDEEDRPKRKRRRRRGSEGGMDPRMRAAIVSAGMSVEKRTLAFTAAADLENPPPGYASGTVPAAYIEGEVYPLAFGKDKPEGAMANLGITFLYDRVIKITTNVEDPANQAIVEVPTQQERFGAGLAYRMLFGDSPTKPSLTFLAGYKQSKFVIDKAMAPVEIDVPNTTYSWVDAGARFRLGLTDAAALNAEATALFVLDTGEMQLPEQYGTATVTGVDADVSVEYWVTPKYVVNAGGRFTALGYNFQGNGELTDRNGDGETDVGGALDSFFGGYLTVGMAF